MIEKGWELVKLPDREDVCDFKETFTIPLSANNITADQIASNAITAHRIAAGVYTKVNREPTKVWRDAISPFELLARVDVRPIKTSNGLDNGIIPALELTSASGLLAKLKAIAKEHDTLKQIED